MKATVFKEHGSVDNLVYTDFAEPEISPSEVLVKVKACGINHLDIWVREGIPGISIPLPHILGCEIAGEIAGVGNTVKNLSIGQRVLVSPGISCGKCEFCLSSNDSLCHEFRIMGFQVNGGYAEYAKAPAENIIPISDKLSFEEWAAVPLVFLTAWNMLKTRGELKTGQTVLIHAAGSGIGSAAIQIARLSGADVITTVGSDEKRDKAMALGANYVINHSKEDFADKVSEFTNGQGVDLVFEHIGPETWEKSMLCLKRGGRIVTCGATSGPTVNFDLRFLFAKQLSISGCYMGSRSELLEIRKLMESGRLKPVVDSVFPLKDAVAAQTKMLDRKQFGKIVLVP
ncbi:MAG: zinc-binding dehydrogenase [Candidatus Scalindua sp.]|jgi:NADPH:quinone reductase-like Zn-dependent oxidoreductase|nr:zinc-binding dehydrogenase [Candidatus Scalindua sp.]MBT5305454.1 zinc-binding dehydrogenase [Candidatus Scalindua sp.]MBT6228585.1 zinc-binding dehydrogenase [Candidatus Scalindua sp.]MBT6560912.1 zinc-binding dehydrogenase [Candidatus Scalindua sp.]MBT7210257.1 zinc-binding dehydrogenase [Candidatus Scalindua sp.]